MSRAYLLLILWVVMVPVSASAEEVYRIGSPCTAKGCVFSEVEALVREAYRRIGKRVAFTPLPVRRELQSARGGQTDASLIRVSVASSECADLVKVPFPVLRTEVSPITTNPGIRIEELEDLAHYKIGGLRGSVVVALLCERAGVLPDRINGLECGIRMLRAGRIDVFLEDRVMAAVAADKIDTRVSVGKSLYSGYFYHWVNKRHAALAPELARAFREMLADGTTKRLLGRYVDMLPSTEWDD